MKAFLRKQYVVRKNTRKSDIHGEKWAEKPHSERTQPGKLVFVCSEQKLIVYVASRNIENYGTSYDSMN